MTSHQVSREDAVAQAMRGKEDSEGVLRDPQRSLELGVGAGGSLPVFHFFG